MIKRICSQWGTHPHEFEPPHEADGIAEIELTQIDPPQDYRADTHVRFVTFDYCHGCAAHEHGVPHEGFVTWYKQPDPRFRWVEIWNK